RRTPGVPIDVTVGLRSNQRSERVRGDVRSEEPPGGVVARRGRIEGQEYRVVIRLIRRTLADRQRVRGWWRPGRTDRAAGHVQQIVGTGERIDVEESEQSDA